MQLLLQTKWQWPIISLCYLGQNSAFSFCGNRTEKQIIFSYVMDIILTLTYQLHFQAFYFLFFLSVFFLIKWSLYHQTKDKVRT